jgi:UDP-N-acetylglucosamine 2-epimerase (non-hydrolysing)
MRPHSGRPSPIDHHSPHLQPGRAHEPFLCKTPSARIVIGSTAKHLADPVSYRIEWPASFIMPYVTFVVGTIPEIVKSIDVALHLSSHGCKVVIYDTRQNRSDAFDVSPSVEVIRTSVLRSEYADDLSWVQCCAAEIATLAKGLVVVQGDTYSALAGAHGAMAAGARLAHIEAGMRSRDPLSPFPEEMIRIFIDSCSDLLFCATQADFEDLADAVNLKKKNVFVVGNTVCDPIFRHAERLRRAASSPLGVFVSLHRRESRQHRNLIKGALSRLTGAFPETPFTFLRRGLLAQTDADEFGPNARMVGVTDHLEFLEMLAGSALVIGDSGGILEESVTLGVPVICVRREIERGRFVEAIERIDPLEIGSERLVELVAAAIKHSRLSRDAFNDTFGDGHSAERIAGILDAYVNGRGLDGAIRPLPNTRPGAVATQRGWQPFPRRAGARNTQ